MIEELRLVDQRSSKDTLKLESTLRSISVRSGITLLVAAVGLQASTITELVNVQGAILSNFISVVVPCSLYLNSKHHKNPYQYLANLLRAVSVSCALLIVSNQIINKLF